MQELMLDFNMPDKALEVAKQAIEYKKFTGASDMALLSSQCLYRSKNILQNGSSTIALDIFVPNS